MACYLRLREMVLLLYSLKRTVTQILLKTIAPFPCWLRIISWLQKLWLTGWNKSSVISFMKIKMVSWRAAILVATFVILLIWLNLLILGISQDQLFYLILKKHSIVWSMNFCLRCWIGLISVKIFFSGLGPFIIAGEALLLIMNFLVGLLTCLAGYFKAAQSHLFSSFLPWSFCNCSSW